MTKPMAKFAREMGVIAKATGEADLAQRLACSQRRPAMQKVRGVIQTKRDGVDGPVITVKYKDGEKKIIVTPDVPIVRFEIGDMSAVKPGVAFTVIRALK